MKWPTRFLVLSVMTIMVALLLRVPSLDRRPMHGDEAVQAIKFCKLIGQGLCRYDPLEYHGLTLNYFTLIPARLSSANQLTDVTEITLRIVPVFFGVLLVLMPFMLPAGLGKKTAIIAAALTAVSPAFVFYSRYYIQEILLVTFTFGVITCGYRYTRNRKLLWAVSAGVFAGLAQASKETGVIAFASMLLALALTRISMGKSDSDSPAGLRKIKWHHIGAAVITAAVVSVLFYSSFFANLSGVADSVRTFATYFVKAFKNPWHIHPWYYYLKMLTYWRHGSGPIWSEGLIIILALVGFVVAISKKSKEGDPKLLRFIAFYTLAMTVAYCAIPYKTPWCALGFLHGLILLAAVGGVWLIGLFRRSSLRTVAVLILVCGLAHLAWQGWLGSHKLSADTTNPYVYAHTSTDIFSIVDRISEVAKVHPDGANTHIQVICSEDDYWPLPWYLRGFGNVGWWNAVDMNAPAAPIIIASPNFEGQLVKKLYEAPPPGQRHLYVPLFDSPAQLRPGVELIALVRQDLWDAYLRADGDSSGNVK